MAIPKQVQISFNQMLCLVLLSLSATSSHLLMRGGGRAMLPMDWAGAITGDWLWQSRWWLLGIVIGWISGLGWAISLRHIPIVLGLPIYNGLLYVLTLAGGALLLDESLSPAQLAGSLLIIAGVMLLIRRA